MKNKILIGVVLSGLLILITPSISAVEHHTYLDTIKKRQMSVGEQILYVLLFVFSIVGGVILHRVFDIPNGGQNLRNLIAHLD